MQQLEHQQISLVGQQIFIALTSAPEWSEFQQFCQALQNRFSLQQLTMAEGADRYQCQFNLQGFNFTLYYEHLCHSMWIESEQQAITRLYEHLLLHC